MLYIHRNRLWLIRVGIIYQPALQYVSVMECGKLYILYMQEAAVSGGIRIPSYHAGMCTVISVDPVDPAPQLNSIPKS